MDTSPEEHENEIVHLDQNLRQIQERKFGEIQRTPDSLPVLEAFQEFLDAERRRARKRMLILTGVFAVFLVAVVGGGVVAVRRTFSGVERDFDSLKDKADAFAERTSENNKATKAALGRLHTKLSDMRSSFATEQGSIVASQSNVETKVTEYEEQVTELQQMLDGIESENASMKTELADMSAKWPAISEEIDALRTALTSRDRRPLPHVESKPSSPFPASTEQLVAALGQPATVMLTVVPPGDDHGIRWRLPLVSTPE